MFDTAIVSDRVVIPPLGVFPLTLGIGGERVQALFANHQGVRAHRLIDARGKIVLPGIIDPHTHIGFVAGVGMTPDALPDQYATESASAVLGGVTTIINTFRSAASYEDIFDQMRESGERSSLVDFSYSLGVLNAIHVDQIPRYYHEFGVSSFKFYMAYKGEDAKATGNIHNEYSDGLLYDGMTMLASIPGCMAMVHPENIEIIVNLKKKLISQNRGDLAAWSESRPDFVEAENVRRALYIGEQVGCPVYIPHVSSAKALEAALEHRLRRTNSVYVETCPHYLTHTMDAELGSLGKVNPPLRRREDQSALWSAMGQDAIDCVGSDHAPLRRTSKGPDIWHGAPGFPGVATSLPVLFEGVRRGAISLLQLALLTSYRVARIFNLFPRKGTLMVGSDADITIIDPTLSRRIGAPHLMSLSDFSIYDGETLTGWPSVTMVRGQIVMENGEVVGPKGHGRYLRRDLSSTVSMEASFSDGEGNSRRVQV